MTYRALITRNFSFIFGLLVVQYAIYRFSGHLGYLASIFIQGACGHAFGRVQVLRGGVFGFGQACSRTSYFSGIVNSTSVPRVSILILVYHITHIVCAISPRLFVGVFIIVMYSRGSILFSIL